MKRGGNREREREGEGDVRCTCTSGLYYTTFYGFGGT